MAQCMAATAAGSQCVSQVVAPSRTLCKRHQTVMANGKSVVNFETGRKFPAPKAAAAPVARAAAPRAAATRAAAAAAPARRTTRSAVAVAEEAPREPRALGEHSLMCDAASCRNMALPGSNYCMQHQSLA